MIKIIACDLDETLLREDDKTVSPENRAAIRAARERGIKFVPCSGRGYKSIAKTLKELDVYNAPGEYLISFNGGAITENRGERLLHFQGMPFDLCDAFYRRGQNYDVCIHVYSKDTVYVRNFFQEERDFLNRRMEVVEVHDKTLDFLRGQELVKILYTSTDRAYLDRIRADLSDLTGDVDVSYSSNRYIEFNQKGVNKGAGLKKLADILGVDMAETMAIGDNYNDLSMIEAAGIGVGVANTVEAMKPECDFVTEADCNHSAVAEAIHRFVLDG